MDRAAPQPPEPAVTRFDLRGRLFGVPLRIHPLFWPAVAVLGWRYYAYPQEGEVGLFFLWLLCVLISLLIHDLAHITVGRLFRARLGVVWYGLGSLTTGLETLPARPARLAVYLAGPLAQLLVWAAVWQFTSTPGGFVASVTDRQWARELITNGLVMFLVFSWYWAILNLLPIWPLDGGLFLWEWCAGLFGDRNGPLVALIVCIFTSAGLGLLIGHWASFYVPFRFDPRESVQLHAYSILLLFCVFFLISGFRALRAEYRLWRGEQRRPAR